MKIATFNVQNLFHRDRSLIQKTVGKCVSDWIVEFDKLLTKEKSASNTERLKELSFLLDFDKTYQNPYVVMRKKVGELYLKGMNCSKELKSGELTDWNGWIKVQTVPIDPEASNHKAMVISEIDPDILVLQEVEDKMSLEEFNNVILPKFKCLPFSECFLTPNSEGRGREQALLLKNGYQLESIKIHNIDDSNITTQELLEYEISTPKGKSIHLLSAYFYENKLDKEKAFEIRKNQAYQVSVIYKMLQMQGKTNIAIVGTLNAPSYCNSLAPLLQETDLKDITKNKTFNVDFDEGKDATYFRLGAYRMGVNIRQEDYLLLSPGLFSNVKNSGLNRKGVWPEKRPNWGIYSTIHNKNQAASGHPGVWGEIKNIK
jgi:endonuclease/exonuclease/phosphatase family metal-dependent hydrolase